MPEDDAESLPRLTLERVRASGSSPRRRRPDTRSSRSTSTARDPLLAGDLVESFLDSQGWATDVAVGSIVARWPELVGRELADHCVAESFDDGTLVIAADSSAWATQLRLLTAQLIGRLAQAVGPGVVTEVVVRGPRAPSWKRGPKSVPGRGPRDTYG